MRLRPLCLNIQFRHPQIHTRRPFLTFPGAEIIRLHERRILPYSDTSVYRLISDVDNYSKFLPYCQASRVTRWSTPDKDGKRWPVEADLTVGWSGIEEMYTSRLYCVPNRIVEALGGDAQTTIPRADLPHHAGVVVGEGKGSSMFKRLSTRWTVRPLQSTSNNAQTEVNLSIEFQFANPLYGTISKAVAPKLADVMITAFEGRAKALLDKQNLRP
jgi:coenzyme Q-binding protein COQ10